LITKQYIIIDIETTWLSKETSRITEIAAVLFDGKKVVSQFQTLINPLKPIPHFITRLTGIDDDMVKDAPTITQALPSFFDFLQDHILVAHNATFDHWFLNHNSLLHHQQSIDNPVLCTRKLANRLVPDLPSKRLWALCQYFNISNARAHRAMADVLATTEIFQQFLLLLQERGVDTQTDIIKFQNFAMYKCI
jgi:DNA polymerase III epsilon subunit family exonuclease